MTVIVFDCEILSSLFSTAFGDKGKTGQNKKTSKASTKKNSASRWDVQRDFNGYYVNSYLEQSAPSISSFKHGERSFLKCIWHEK